MVLAGSGCRDETEMVQSQQTLFGDTGPKASPKLWNVRVSRAEQPFLAVSVSFGCVVLPVEMDAFPQMAAWNPAPHPSSSTQGRLRWAETASTARPPQGEPAGGARHGHCGQSDAAMGSDERRSPPGGDGPTQPEPPVSHLENVASYSGRSQCAVCQENEKK